MLVILYTAFSSMLCANELFVGYYEVKAKSGDSVLGLLSQFDLHKQPCNIDAFYNLNGTKADSYVYSGKTYKLPLYIFAYNGTSIRSTIGNTDYEKAIRIQNYNREIERKRGKSAYEVDRQLYVPGHELDCAIYKSSSATIHEPILGQDRAFIKRASTILKGKTIYLVPGHGGPDPGSITYLNERLLCEDEYAYDVCLRTYEKLIANGAEVILLVQDPNDGIRNGKFLDCDKDEISSYGKTLPLNQLKRLQLRVQEVNTYFPKYAYEDQLFLSIHVDSRSKSKKQDVFFCHYTGSRKSAKIAEQFRQTFAKKYAQHQKNRTYHGSTQARNLYVLKHSKMPSILVEIGNIQNTFDHRRILRSNNREVLSEWLYEAVVATFE